MTITYSLPGFRLISQLSEPTQDTYPDENARNNCVVASISMALDYLTGGNYDGDELKDAVYGQGYIGPMSAAKYEAYCAARGVTLAPHDGSQADLIATIHAQVDAGHPVLVTMPSQWGTPYPDPVHPSGSTHVGVAYGTGPGMIRCANPWGGFAQDESDTWWQSRLCYGQVWPMVKAAGASMSGVPAVSWSDDGSTLTAPNKQTCGHGIRAHIMGESWPAELWPVTGEEWDAVGVHQDFRNGGDADAAGRRLTWHKVDNSITEGALASPAVALQGQLTAAQQSAAAATAGQQAAQASLSAANAQIEQLQAQIAALKSQPAPAPAPVPTPPANPAPTTPAAAATLLVSLIYAEAQATLKAVTPAS